MHKKTKVSELSALLTVVFAIYQGHKHGLISPDLIGQLVLHGYDFASVIIPAAVLAIRLAYKKWFRKPKVNDESI